MIDKIRRKLDEWNAKLLSLAGRVTLARSVILAIPNDFMQTVEISRVFA